MRGDMGGGSVGGDMEGGSVWEGIWKEVVCGRGYGRR